MLPTRLGQQNACEPAGQAKIKKLDPHPPPSPPPPKKTLKQKHIFRSLVMPAEDHRYSKTYMTPDLRGWETVADQWYTLKPV